MSGTLFDGSGLDRMVQGFEAVTSFDAMPLMKRWEDIVVEGNRRGVLAGLDGRNQRMPPLQYRDGGGKRTKNRRAPQYGTGLHDTSGAGPYAAGLHDNLTSSQYRQLTGPRLAPRGEASRVIKNLHTEIRSFPTEGRWEVVGAWYQKEGGSLGSSVVSVKGVPFLIYHFEGQGRNPKYDLRPVRPEDLKFAANALRAFVKEHFLSHF